MIILSCIERPSSLLRFREQDLSRQARALRERCINIALPSNPGITDALWQDVHAFEKGGNAAEYAMILIYLSDVFRRSGRLGPAYQSAEKAEKILAQWPHCQFKHNHAVALYTVALIQQLLGFYQEAYESYIHTLDEFEQAKQYWRAFRMGADWVQRCERAVEQIEQLLAYATESRTLGTPTAHYCSLLGYWFADKKSDRSSQPLVDISLHETATCFEMRRKNDVYRLEQIEYHRQDIPKELAQTPSNAQAPDELQNAEYVLVREELMENTFGVGAKRGSSSRVLWGNFVRDDNDEIQLEAWYEDGILPNPRIIGEKELDLEISGSVVAVFKPSGISNAPTD